MEASIRNKGLVAGVVLLMAATWSAGSMAGNDDNTGYFEADLSALNILPSLYTPAYGTLTTEVDPYGKYIYYKLFYEKMSDKVTAAHIHFAQKFADGGPIAFLCGGSKPPCPEYSGWVEGKLDAADIIGPAGQGINSGDIKSAISAMKKGLVYGNVHNARYPAGELRGQLYPAEEDNGGTGGGTRGM